MKNNSRPPTDYRRISFTTIRNIALGFTGVLLLVGAIFIPYSYGWLGFAGGLACVFAAIIPVGLTVLAVFGIDWLSKWLDRE